MSASQGEIGQMSSRRLPLALSEIIANVEDLDQLPASEKNLSRTGAISFEYRGELGYHVHAWKDIFPENGAGKHEGKLALPKSAVFAAIDNCRRVWQDNVISMTVPDDTGVRYPFCDEWDLSEGQDSSRFNDVGLKLARAGNDLFNFLFGQGDEGVTEIGELLTTALISREQVLAFHSNDLFAPWWMLYTPPNGTNLEGANATWKPEGFWGYRHLIEHLVDRVRQYETRIVATRGQVRVSLNVDPRIDEEESTPFVESIISFFHGATSEPEIRKTRDELRSAVKSLHFNDQIVYFGCHGRVSTEEGAAAQPSLALMDDEPIFATDFDAWLSKRNFDSNPIVFMNACQAGQLASRLYPSFGLTLLKRHANCLVGPQVNLPVRFGAEYATRLFRQLLNPQGLPKETIRLGEIMRALTREFIDIHNNPLGLIFSLYRGMDTHFSFQDMP